MFGFIYDGYKLKWEDLYNLIKIILLFSFDSSMRVVLQNRFSCKDKKKMQIAIKVPFCIHAL